MFLLVQANTKDNLFFKEVFSYRLNLTKLLIILYKMNNTYV